MAFDSSSLISIVTSPVLTNRDLANKMTMTNNNTREVNITTPSITLGSKVIHSINFL
jgi:hypothetical protein